MKYATGRYAFAICDRCAFRYPYLELRKEWTGFRVCPECFEAKHPQLGPFPVIDDPQGLENPRPQDTDTSATTNVTPFPPSNLTGV